MTIEQLKKVLEKAPNENAKVFINGLPQNNKFDIDWNYDDMDDLDLYITYKTSIGKN